MKKSILFDVLNFIDRVHRIKTTHSTILPDNVAELMNKSDQASIKKMYDAALSYDPVIEVLFYIPESSNNPFRFTVFMLALRDKAFLYNSIDTLIGYIRGKGKKQIRRNIIKYSFYDTLNDASDNYIDNFIDDLHSDNLNVLNDAKFTDEIKFSISGILYNYDHFLDEFISYIKMIADDAAAFYKKNEDWYKNAGRLIKAYVSDDNLLNFINSKSRNALEILDREYTIVIQLIMPDYRRVFCSGNKAICAKGLCAIRDDLHIDSFVLFKYKRGGKRIETVEKART